MFDIFGIYCQYQGCIVFCNTLIGPTCCFDVMVVVLLQAK